MKNEEEKKEVNLNKPKKTDIVSIVCCGIVFILNVFSIIMTIITKEVKPIDYILSCCCCICWCLTALIFNLELIKRR